MDPSVILVIILIIISFDFVFEQILDYINLKSQNKDIPATMKGYYDEEKYLKSQSYHGAHTRFSFLTSTFSFLLSFGLLYFGFFGWLDINLRLLIGDRILLSLAYFGILFILSDIINTPFQIYSTFVIEERFGFNKTTAKTFILDKVKGYLLSVLIGGLLGWVFLALVAKMGTDFWIYFLVVIALFILFMNMFYTTLILPLFNKLTPLEDGKLKEEIMKYCRKVSFPLTNIFVMDGSKRSKKSNAFFTGLGKKKKVVLYDTLVENHSDEELLAILAHEVGHYKKKHIISGYIASLVQVGLTLFLLSLMIFNLNLSLALDGDQWAIHLNLLAFTILYSPISKVAGILMLIFSRRNEYQADAYASNTYDADALSMALKKLSVDNLSDLYPHAAYVFFNYSHPPLLKRLAALERVAKSG